jgi:signal transduction histidine kinase
MDGALLPAVTIKRGQDRVAAILILAAAGVLASTLSLWYLAGSVTMANPGLTAVARGTDAAFYVGVGLYTWWRRPDSRYGLLLAAVGFEYTLTAANGSSDAVTFALAMTLWVVYILGLVYIYLAFPRGRLTERGERIWFGVMLLSCVVLWSLILVFAERLPISGPFADCGDRCPDNGLQVVATSPEVGHALDVLFTAVTNLALVGVAVVIYRKTRSPSRLRSRALRPLCYAVVLLIVAFLLFRTVGSALPATRPGLKVLAMICSFIVPAAIVVGQVRGRMFAASRIGQLAVAVRADREVTASRIQDLMREALGDPGLVLALAVPEAGIYVDPDGARVELPAPGSDRVTTPVVQNGETVANVVHDALLDADDALIEGLAASSFMLLENARLVDELRASRGRIATAAEHERLRLERDLHDGAQQRLMAIQIKLSLLRDRLGNDELTGDLDEISEDATAAVDELRGLAHGIYPTVLRERGLADGLRKATAGSPVPVEIAEHGIGRFDSTVEAAVYFCVLEAVQNATKHAGDGAHLTVTLERTNGELRFAVVDDGVGFDEDAALPGMGIVSMRDRISAVSGDLQLQSFPGRGTTVRGTVPVG